MQDMIFGIISSAILFLIGWVLKLKYDNRTLKNANEKQKQKLVTAITAALDDSSSKSEEELSAVISSNASVIKEDMSKLQKAKALASQVLENIPETEEVLPSEPSYKDDITEEEEEPSETFTITIDKDGTINLPPVIRDIAAEQTRRSKQHAETPNNLNS